MKCPGQDTRFWDKNSIYDVTCIECGAKIEFFKDDVWRKCRECGKKMPNPKLNLGCATHCPYGEKCIERISKDI